MNKKSKTLLVIVPDRLTDIINKGEFTPRYYNPGELFDQVHILMTNDDQPDVKKLQPTVGRAKLKIHNLPEPDLIKSGLFNDLFLNLWSRPAIELARKIKPDLIRCHGAYLNSYLAYRIKKEMGISYVVSLHINPDVNIRSRSSIYDRIYWSRMQKVEKIGLINADMVLPVYKPIIPYLERMGVEKFQIAYNVLNGKNLVRKVSYDLHKPIRLISVGRLIADKSVENIIQAVAKIRNVKLTVVGQGPIETDLKQLVQQLGCEKKVTFVRAIPNNKLCQMLSNQDIFVVYSEYWEISKAILEALLTGLPVIINRRKGEPVPELKGDFVLKVNGDKQSYTAAINKLVTNSRLRKKMGQRAYQEAKSKWAPEVTENKYVDLYQSFLTNA